MSSTHFALRRVLASPLVYSSAMTALGADSGMQLFVQEYLRVHPGDRILDLGCGPGRLYPHLPPSDYCGLDVDARTLVRARALYPGARFERQDIATGCPNFNMREFDLIVASGLFHHLPDAAVKRALDFCRDRLRIGGRLITLDCAFEKEQNYFSRWLIARDRGHFVRCAQDYLDLVCAYFPGATVAVRHDMLRVPYTHAIVECEKR